MGARDRSGIIFRLRRRTAAVLWAEVSLGAMAPAFGILLSYLIVVLFGFGRPWLFGAVIIFSLLALGFGVSQIHRPRLAAIDRRIEGASGLKHRPLAALADAPETDDALALAMWQAHQTHIEASLTKFRSGGPVLQSALRDPLSLRVFLLLLLLTGFLTAGQNISIRLAAGFALPAWPFAGPEINAWITPPDYAGAPPHLLTASEAVMALPRSKLTIIISGLRYQPRMTLSKTAFIRSDLSETSHRADAVIEQSGRLTIGPWWHHLAAWNITMVPPSAPVITLTKITVAPGSKMTLGWQVKDPYGLAEFSMAFHIAGYPDALAENFALPLQADGSVTIDRSESPYHNLPVHFSMSARNFGGVTGQLNSGDRFYLPGLNLHDKTAIKLDALRQALALEPKNTLIISQELQILAATPPSAVTAAADVQMAVLASAMALQQISASEAVNQLLALIKETNAGKDFAADHALRQSNAALLSALQNGLQGKAPNASQIQQLMQAMEQALAQRLANTQPQNTPGQTASQIDLPALDRLAAQIARDEAAGRTAEAAKELQQLQAALNALANAQPMTAQQAAQAQAAGKAARGLSQEMSGEAALLNNTNQGTANSAQQAALQSALAGIQQGLKGAGINNLPGIGQAGQAMGKAATALGQSDNQRASTAEMAAIQNLQKAAAALNAARQNQLSISDSNGQGNGPMPDPLPFDTGVNGAPDMNFRPGADTPVANPASTIQQRIMKQDSEPGLPPQTHEYFERLLNP